MKQVVEISNHTFLMKVKRMSTGEFSYKPPVRVLEEEVMGVYSGVPVLRGKAGEWGSGDGGNRGGRAQSLKN